MQVVTINYHSDYVVIGRTSKELINLAIDEYRKDFPSRSIFSIKVRKVSGSSKILKYTP